MSVGQKYLLAPPLDAHYKLNVAYEEFCNKIRWRIKFLLESNDNEESDFDPDYEVPHTVKECNFRLAYIEDRFSAGQRLVSNAISK